MYWQKFESSSCKLAIPIIIIVIQNIDLNIIFVSDMKNKASGVMIMKRIGGEDPDLEW